MSADWPLVNLGDVVELHTGFPFKSKEYSGDGLGHKLLRGDNIVQGCFRWENVKLWPTSKIIEKHKNYWLKDGDVILAMDRPWIESGLKYAQITEVDLPCLLVQRTSCLRAKNGFSQNFLRYLISSYSFVEYVKLVLTGTVVPHISGKQILDFEFKLPPESIQIKIGKVLRGLDSKIQLNRQTNQTLENIAQAIFKSWFVDFEPTRAKIAAKEAFNSLSLRERVGVREEDLKERAAMAAISGKSIEALDQLKPEQQQQLKTTAALFPDALVESELGEIPEGWEVTELGEILEFNPRRVLKRGTLAPYLDMKNVPIKGHLANDVYLREMASGTKFINGDTLLARITPCLENGKTAYVDFLENDQVAWGSTEYIVMRPKDGRPMSLGYIIARLDSFRTKAIQTMTGTSGRQRANAKALSEQAWVDYPEGLLEQFNHVAGSYLDKAKINGCQNKILSKIRDALLPKLLAGQIKEMSDYS